MHADTSLDNSPILICVCACVRVCVADTSLDNSPFLAPISILDNPPILAPISIILERV